MDIVFFVCFFALFGLSVLYCWMEYKRQWTEDGRRKRFIIETREAAEEDLARLRRLLGEKGCGS